MTIYSLFYRLLSKLHEPNCNMIAKVIDLIDGPVLRTVLAITMERENAGGDLTQDLSRRRTPGGIFLSELKTQLRNSGNQDALLALKEIWLDQTTLHRKASKAKRNYK